MQINQQPTVPPVNYATVPLCFYATCEVPDQGASEVKALDDPQKVF